MKNLVFLSRPAVVCSAGMNLDDLWTSVILGDNSAMIPTKVRSGKRLYAARIPESRLLPSNARFDMHIIRMENAALEQLAPAVNKAISVYGKERVGVCVGSCDNGSEFSVAAHTFYFESGVFPSSYELEMQGADYVATFVKEKFGISGATLAFATACSSSAGAIIKAAQLVRSGALDAVVTGGVDIASDTVLLGFNSLEAVSPQPTNPFSKNRSGITLGDAAAFFVLSRAPLDSEKICLAGYGESSDAFHLTSPESSGEGAISAMQKALKSAELLCEEIDYVNLHGTGTKLNDSMEARAMNAVFGEYNVPCSSTKSITGHTLGAAAALEAAICWKTLDVNSKNEEKIVLPPQVWDGDFDSEIPKLQIVSKGKEIQCKRKQISRCMSNSFAFGGANASLIFERR